MPVVGLSPYAATGVGVGVGDATPVVWISPARTEFQNTHARVIVKAKRLILPVSPLRLRNASVLARKQDSVNTYTAIDTGLRAVSNIPRWQSTTSYHSRQRVNLREDGLT